LPYVSGAFEWSGFDYKGEPVPNMWPDVNSHFGFLDIAGFVKERGYWQQIWLANPDPPQIHLFPHWNWASTATTTANVTAAAAATSAAAPCTGRCKQRGGNSSQPTITVFAFSNVVNGTIELLLNGRPLGNDTVTKVGGWSTWMVPYTPGTLVAKAYRAGQPAASCAETSVSTTGAPASLRVSIKDSVGANGIVADGRDIALVMVEVLDSQGRVVPVASNMLTFAVSDPSLAQIIGTGNGDPTSHTPDKSLVREAFNGVALAVVQSIKPPPAAAGGAAGAIWAPVTISVTSPGLEMGSVSIQLLPPPAGTAELDL